jgi:lipoprotein-releasing system ATP-binding protein
MSNLKIEVKAISKGFRDADNQLLVIDSVSHLFPATGTVAITGRSGIGKSTLLHLLGGLERPSSGSIFYDGQDITQLNAEQLAQFRGKNVGFIFQFHHLLGEFSALENVAMPLIILRVAKDDAMAQAEQLLRKVGLESRLNHRPGQLSGGEQQRVSIARALISRPRVVLADEPTGNLDIRTAREVQDLLKQMNRELGNLMIIVTHLDELASAMDCVLEMEQGGQLKEIKRSSSVVRSLE